ncbi:MAG: glutamate-1-semialdehyde 2,1-aminomutase [Planctomycetales bacterium]|nr:glutamate-1-semialdehyde 2,1-aminomutase [Planctomycetales bacterium]
MPDLTKSQQAFAEAVGLMPGGVNSPARAFGAVGGSPIIFASGQGAELTDIDGNRYLDYIGSWGPMILGHCHPQVVRAVTDAAARGFSFGAPTLAENRIAKLIIQTVPSVEMVRLVNSGTEATMSAIRLARGFTGRDKIIKFAGNYHGHVDSLLVAAGSSAATLGVPNSPGVTAGCVQDTLVLRYNDVEGFAAAMDTHGDQVAAVILEPVVGNMGCVRASDEFAAALRRQCTDRGAVLIFDEVMSGYRVALGGAQEVLGVQPDLTTLGKIVGGGLPLGAYGGRREIMQQVLPAGKVFQAGTLSGNPLATAAGAATLTELIENSPYERLEALSSQLAEGLQQCAELVGGCVQRVGSMMTLFFHPGPIRSWDDAAAADTDRYGRFFWELIERGIYFPCSQFEALFVSAAHTESDIQRTIDAALEAAKAVS